MAKLGSSRPAPPNTPTDAPATQKWVDTHYASRDSNSPQKFSSNIEAPQVITSMNVKSFGAKGNGTHDDTKAIQAAVNKFTVSGGGRLYFPAGTYRITSAIVIPFSTNWVIEGDSREASIIVQATSNTPIFKLTSNNTWGWTIRNLLLKAQTAQVSTNTSAAGVMVTNSAGVYNWVIENCHFINLANCVYSDTGTALWGGTMRDIVVDPNVSRSVVQMVSPVGGQPNNKFENIYVRADTMVGPVFDLAGALSTWYTGIEINNALLGPSIISDVGGGTHVVGSLRVEVGTYSASVTTSSMFNISNSNLFAQHIELLTITADMTSVVFPRNCVFRLSASLVNVAKLDMNNWSITNGNFYVVGGMSTGDVKFGALDAMPTNVLLTNLGFDASGDLTQVLNWNDGQLSANQGDANVTVTPGGSQPNVLSFETNLTANRTVTLPQSTSAGNMFNGLTYRIVRSGAGAFTLQINDGALGAIDTFGSAVTGAMDFTFRRSKWVKTMKSLF